MNYNKESLATAFDQHHKRLERIVMQRLNPILRKRLTVEDVLQDTWLAISKRIDFFNQPFASKESLEIQDKEQLAEIQIFVQFRFILIQTLSELERFHLASQKRDAYREQTLAVPEDITGARPMEERWADSMTSPRSKVANQEKYQIVRNVLEELPLTDREILTLRHFEDLTNAECAATLNIDPKAASIRYIRALKRLHERLAELSAFEH